MVVSIFFILDKDDKEIFFEESFLLADIKLDAVFGMLFLTMSNTNVDFQAQNLQWRSYTTGDVLLTIGRVELIKKKEFVVAALDPEYKAFLIYIVALNISSNIDDKMHPLKRAQIVYLKANRASIEVSSKCANFIDIFSSKLATNLSKYMSINNHAIKLVDD